MQATGSWQPHLASWAYLGLCQKNGWSVFISGYRRLSVFFSLARLKWAMLPQKYLLGFEIEADGGELRGVSIRTPISVNPQ